jgi:PDZ domain-containing protein
MTDLDHMTAGDAGPFLPSPVYGVALRRRRWPYVLLVIFAVLLLIWWGLGFWSVNYYVITPGDATPVAPLISVPANLDHPLTGKILLTDVYVSPLTARSYIQYRYFSSDSQVVSAGSLLGPSTPEDQFVAQGYLDMTQAQSFATAAALTYLGKKVSAQPAGALIYGITPGTPAASLLKVAQVITAIDGKATTSACALVGALHGLKPGTSVTMSIEESTISASGTFRAGPIVQKKLTLSKPPAGATDAGCAAHPTLLTGFLGIEPENQYTWSFPVKVTVHTADIGGPSAGLSMTLGIIDKLSGGDLTGKRIVAATGTIDPSGAVGDVGGVAEKTIAVERAGATVFLVPPEELKAAESKATPQLHVYAVSSLDEALRILKRLGGTLPTSHVSAQAAP